MSNIDYRYKRRYGCVGVAKFRRPIATNFNSNRKSAPNYFICSNGSPQPSTQAGSSPSNTPPGVSVSIDNNRVVNIIQLQKDICADTNASSWNAAQFAMEMIEGVQRVNFMITDSANTESDDAEEFAYY